MLPLKEEECRNVSIYVATGDFQSRSGGYKSRNIPQNTGSMLMTVAAHCRASHTPY